MHYDLKSVRDADVAGKRVLLRTSLNVPLATDGTISDTYRLRRALPTLFHLTERGARVVLIGYFGREGATLRPVFDTLSRLAKRTPMHFSQTPVQSVLPEVEALAEGECLVLENMRLYAGEEHNDAAFARELAALADVFVNDSFAEAHRSYASNAGVAALMPSFAGLLLLEEVTRLSEALLPPAGSVAVIGGAKYETKQPLIEKIAHIYDRVLIGGALANDFLKARMVAVGASLISDEAVGQSVADLPQIAVPEDVVLQSPRGVRASAVADIQADERIVDVGPQTATNWSQALAEAPLALWNGPLGLYEGGFSHATDMIARAIAQGRGRAIIGGGDTDAAVAKFQFDPERVFRSTGGGAMLQFLTEGTLPSIEALKQDR